jgi:hypothetical protein
MTIIVFLIDTSASMNQRAYLGGRPTLLDVAKGAVETFVKVRGESLRRITFAKSFGVFSVRQYRKRKYVTLLYFL